jgi:CP family cyanate transporter-like MFS transporter
MRKTTKPDHALRDSLVAIAGVILIAANLRAAVSGLSPIYDIVSRDVPLGIDARALLGSLPPIGFVIGGLLTPRLTRRIGLEWNLVALVAIIMVGHLLRSVATDWTVLAVGSAMALIGSGMGNVSLPPVIKKYFPQHIGTMSASYIAFVSLGSVIPPLIVVPLSEAASWRWTMVLWAAFAAISLIPWLLQIRKTKRLTVVAEIPAPARQLTLRRSPTAWAIAVAFSVSSITGYGMFAWLPDIAKDAAGMSELNAAILLSIFAFAGTPMSVAMPLIAARIKNVGWLTATGGLLIGAGFLGMLVAPTVAPYLWVILFGTGPLLFPLALVLINLRTESTAASLQLSSFAQFVAYSVAAVVPPLMGLSRAVSGNWDLALAALALTGIGTAWSAVVLSRNNSVESELSPNPTNAQRGSRN